MRSNMDLHRNSTSAVSSQKLIRKSVSPEGHQKRYRKYAKKKSNKLKGDKDENTLHSRQES